MCAVCFSFSLAFLSSSICLWNKFILLYCRYVAIKFSYFTPLKKKTRKFGYCTNFATKRWRYILDSFLHFQWFFFKLHNLVKNLSNFIKNVFYLTYSFCQAYQCSLLFVLLTPSSWGSWTSKIVQSKIKAVTVLIHVFQFSAHWERYLLIVQDK